MRWSAVTVHHFAQEYGSDGPSKFVSSSKSQIHIAVCRLKVDVCFWMLKCPGNL